MASLKAGLGSILLLSGVALPLWPETAFAGSVEATQLDYVALDSTVSCNRMFFRSSEHFKGTIFMMPRVIAGPGFDEHRRTYHIVPLPTGEYLLNLHLFFPDSDEDVRAKGASSITADGDACNTDHVKEALNRDVVSDDLKVRTIARIPLTSIEVQIPGIKSVARVGRSLESAGDEVDILDYNAKVLTATFTISEREKDYFLSQVVDQEGLSASVKFRFQARNRDGSVHAEVNVKNLRTAFAAAVKGKFRLTRAEVAAALRTSLDSRSVTITTEAGKSGTSGKVAEMITNKILTDVDTAVESVTSTAPASDPNGSTVSVDSAMDILSSSVHRRIDFDQIGLPETATAQTEIRIRVTSLRDPNTQEVWLRAHYLQPSLGVVLNAGKTMTITATAWILERIDYSAVRTTYMTSGMISELNLGSYFPVLTDRALNLQDVRVNGTVMAIGKKKMLNGWLGGANDPGEYRWRRLQRMPRRIRVESGNVPATQQAMMSLPAGLSFSALGAGNIVRFGNLFEENPYWSARFNQAAGRLELTAKQNLGLVQFRQLMHAADEVQEASIVTDSAVQEYRHALGSISFSEPVELSSDDRALVLQKSIKFIVSRPVNGLPMFDVKSATGLQ